MINISIPYYVSSIRQFSPLQKQYRNSKNMNFAEILSFLLSNFLSFCTNLFMRSGDLAIFEHIQYQSKKTGHK